uniref:Uncharacterized protein n=1 Tax=Arion vulgaris TaxID=1028688 RepID=A0A0B7BR54_9EUPU
MLDGLTSWFDKRSMSELINCTKERERVVERCDHLCRQEWHLIDRKLCKHAITTDYYNTNKHMMNTQERRNILKI